MGGLERGPTREFRFRCFGEHEEARQKGVAQPLLVHLPGEEEPFSIGWL
jgi:hypothetical protein